MLLCESMSQHHPVISRYRAYSGPVPPRTSPDFLGTMTRQDYISGFVPINAESYTVENYLPAFDEEYFEWISLLESAIEARGSYVMMELGAGFGRWAVRAATAIQQAQPGLPFSIFAVEAEPTVYGWMRDHFAHNGLDPAAHQLIHGAVSEAPGDVFFYVGGPKGGPYDKRPENWYGQCLTKDYDAAANGKPDGSYQGHAVTEHPSGWRSIRVPGVSLKSLLSRTGHADLIDMDIEGQELESVTTNIDALDAKVRRLHIGTHSVEIEDGLRRLLSAHGWECRADYSLFSECDTPYGRIRFENGAQTWVNPRRG